MVHFINWNMQNRNSEYGNGIIVVAGGNSVDRQMRNKLAQKQIVSGILN